MSHGAPLPGSCEHPTMADHSRLDGDVRIWRCSSCGREGAWTETWSYYGDYECPRCWRTTIEWVACSVACVLPTPEGRGRPKTKAGAGVRTCSRCGQTGHYAPTCARRTT